MTKDEALKIFEKDYDGESLYDLGLDISMSLDERENPIIDEIPKDEYGIQLGTFKVTIEWSKEE
jgi:hypothetical protein